MKVVHDVQEGSRVPPSQDVNTGGRICGSGGAEGVRHHHIPRRRGKSSTPVYGTPPSPLLNGTNPCFVERAQTSFQSD